MKKIILYTALGLMTTVSFLACSDDADTTGPVIELIEPEDGDSLLIGSTNGIHLEMNLSDNGMLQSYLIEIHSNFDGHSHSTKTTEETTPFSFHKSYDVPGLRNCHVHQHEIMIPSDATLGKYHLMVYCTDKAGNQSFIATNIVLSHDAKEHED